MNKLLLVVVLLCAFCASSSFARIGETEAQIEKRYGKPLKTIPASKTIVLRKYQAAGFEITVSFAGGTSHGECFQKAAASELSEAEVTLLLYRNTTAPEHYWSQPSQTKDVLEVWTCSDDATVAFHDHRANQLTVILKSFMEEFNAAIKLNEAENLKGF